MPNQEHNAGFTATVTRDGEGWWITLPYDRERLFVRAQDAADWLEYRLPGAQVIWNVKG